jgi:squalene-hopene/tetraprenyl-beta-curcumene cyclase
MQEARANILRLGGIPRDEHLQQALPRAPGQFPWQYLPTIPVEMILLPNWAPFHIYKMSSWSRAMLVPLAIINHFKPTRELPGDETAARACIRSAPSTRISGCRATRAFTWRNFSCAPITLKILHRLAPDAPARARGSRALDAGAHRRGERWPRHGFPAMLNALIALRASVIRTAIRLTQRPKGFRGIVRQ